MNETTYSEAKQLHEQIESISSFVDKAKSDDVTSIDLFCDGYTVKISKKSKVFETIMDFCEKALVQLDEKFGKL